MDFSTSFTNHRRRIRWRSGSPLEDHALFRAHALRKSNRESRTNRPEGRTQRRNLMPTSLEDQRFAQQSATVFHPMSTADKTAMAGLRAIVEPNKGRLRGTARSRDEDRNHRSAGHDLTSIKKMN
jgi:hypothetical protein